MNDCIHYSHIPSLKHLLVSVTEWHVFNYFPTPKVHVI